MACPTHLRIPHPPLCISAHPTEPRLVIGLTNGVVHASTSQIFPTGTSDSNSAAIQNVSHPLSAGCQATALHPSANSSLFFAATDSIVHVYDAGRKTALHSYTIPAHDDTPCTATSLLPLDENVLLAGDDEGALHLFDIRKPFESAVALKSTLDHGDYIASLSSVDRFGTKAILSASGDGTLCAFEVRNPPHPHVKLQYATDSYNDDLLSLAVLDGTPLAVAGCLSGALNLYNLRFLDVDADAESVAHVDRFHGHPECVNAVLTCSHDDVIITACSDGFVRVVDIINKTLIGVLDYNLLTPPEDDGEDNQTRRRSKRKKTESRWPIESMVAINGADVPIFALLLHDEFVRFCDGSALVDDEDEDNENDEADGEITNDKDNKQNSDGTTGGDASEEASRSQNGNRLCLPPEAELKKSSKKAKQTKKRRKDEDPSERATDEFFDDL